LAQLAKYTEEQAQMLNSHGITELLVNCITKEQEDGLKREALVALTEIAKHTDRLADAVLGEGGDDHLIRLISSANVYIRRQVFSYLKPYLGMRLFGTDWEAFSSTRCKTYRQNSWQTHGSS